MTHMRNLNPFQRAWVGIFTGMTAAAVLVLGATFMLWGLGIDLILISLSFFGTLAVGVLEYTKLTQVDDLRMHHDKVRGKYRAHEHTGHFNIVPFSMSTRRWYWTHVWRVFWPSATGVLLLAVLSLVLHYR